MSDATQTVTRDRALNPTPLSDKLRRRMHAYWRAANYISVGQIYLLANPLLREPLKIEHTKPRLLGHWGTTPGLNFLYVHLNRAIVERDLNTIYVCGPGHGGPGMVANAYLEGTYSELYSAVSQDEVGLGRLFKQFSFPGGIPSHAAPETPGSIHEGGELGYSLSHAVGAALDNPDSADVRAYAVQQGHRLTVVLDDVEDPATSGATTVTLNLGADLCSGRLTALTTSSSAGLSATAGISLGGQQVGPHGAFPPPQSTPVAVHNQTATVTVPAGSAAIIQFD